jgi:L-aminopeptidase/D-esterase-like protein
MTLKCFLFKTGSDVTLDEQTFALTAPIDTAAALEEVQDGMTITQESDGTLVADFPSVSDFVSSLGYKINTSITVGTLPAGTHVSVSMNGGTPVTRDISTLPDLDSNPGTRTFSFTDFFGVSAANFTAARYSNATETYDITVSGNTVPIDTTMTLKCFLFKAGSADVVLDQPTFDLTAPIDTNAALNEVRGGMTITRETDGTIVATFPAVSDFITGLGYKINSNITVGTLPAGSLVSVSMNGGTPVTRSLDDLTDLDMDTNPDTITFSFTDFFRVSAADFTRARYNNAVETYDIIITGNTAPIHTTMSLKCFLFKTGSDVTLEVQTFHLDVTAPDYYTVEFIAGAYGSLTGATHFTDIPKDTEWSTIAVPATIPDTGHHFAGWSDDFPGTIEGNLSFTASFAPNTYTVTFNGNGGGTPSPRASKLPSVQLTVRWQQRAEQATPSQAGSLMRRLGPK